jgi:cytochrome c-type biogenesis protein CcmH/NrfG
MADTTLTEDTTEADGGVGTGADVQLTWPARASHWRLALAFVIVIVIVIGIGSWQFVSLHHQVHELQNTTHTQSQQLSRQNQGLSSLRNSVSAAVSCLETPQVQAGLCAHFLR